MVESKLAQWWRPERPDEKLPGTLFEDSERGGIRLLIDGHFTDPNPEISVEGGRIVKPPLDDVPLLVGITAAGKFLSLLDCRVVKGSGIPGLTKTFQVFWPSTIAYDVHFTSPSEFLLTFLSGRFSNLDQWVDTSGISYSFPSGCPYPVSVTYSRPENLKTTLSNGLSLEVRFSVDGPDTADRRRVQIEQQAWLAVSSPDERTYEELVRALTMMADFVSLGVGQAVRLGEMQAGGVDEETKNENSPKPIYFPLHHNSEPIAPAGDDIHPREMLFTLNDIRENFGGILEAWFVQQEKIRPLYSLYFGTLRSPRMYVEHRFLNMFQALEAFDRRGVVYTPEEEEKHRERVSRIAKVVEDRRDRDWVKGRLRRIDEPQAKERIHRLVEKYDAAWVFDDAAQEIQLAADFRNFYTHYDPKYVSMLPDASLSPTCALFQKTGRGS